MGGELTRRSREVKHATLLQARGKRDKEAKGACSKETFAAPVEAMGESRRVAL